MMDPIVRRVVNDALLRDGKHIHVSNFTNTDEVCQGGDSECPLWNIQLDEAMETWSGS